MACCQGSLSDSFLIAGHVPHSALLGALVAQVPVQTGCIQAKVLGATSYLFSMGV